MMSQSPLLPELLYVGTEGGSVWVTKDEGENWKKVGAELPRKWVSRVVASSHAPGTVYLSMTGFREDDFDAYLFRSTDFGQSWLSIRSNLPMESVNVIAEDPDRPDILYVGTDLGVYVSGDTGQNWVSLSTTLPTTPVHDLDVHPRDGALVIGTHGRSAWVLELAAVREYFTAGRSPKARPPGAEGDDSHGG
jgi:photosystem II stability/assembly factor-like uncharacterized protein